MTEEKNTLEAALPALTSTMGVLSPQQVQAQMGAVQSILKKVLKEGPPTQPGTHYGIIPGTKQATLYQSGAEKLMLAFQLRGEYKVLPDSVVDRQEKGGFISYTVRCRLYHRPTGILVAESIGNCNSRERKYLTRTVYPDKASAEELEFGTREIRNGRRGDYEVIVVPVDPFEIMHTILTMAKKRAKVGTVREALAASDALEIDGDQAAYLQGVANDAEQPKGTDAGAQNADLAAKAEHQAKLGKASEMAGAWVQTCGDGEAFAEMVKSINDGDPNPVNMTTDQLAILMERMAAGLEAG